MTANFGKPSGLTTCFIILILFMAISGCQEVKETLIDCVAQPKNVELETKGSMSAISSSNFSEELTVSVSNTTSTGFYIGQLEVSGDMPNGLKVDIVHDFDRNYLLINGVPTLKGEFQFTIKVNVGLNPDPSAFDPDASNSAVCDGVTSRSYTIVVS